MIQRDQVLFQDYPLVIQPFAKEHGTFIIFYYHVIDNLWMIYIDLFLIQSIGMVMFTYFPDFR